jgi:hypothetical protein
MVECRPHLLLYQCVECPPHILFCDFDYYIFNMFIEFYSFLSTPQYVLKSKNGEPEDDLNSRNMLVCK